MVLRPGEADPTRLDISEAARARIAEALTAGFVVVPERPVALGEEERVGWWLVDPATGATEDQMDDGRGTEMSEFALTMRIALCTASLIVLGAAAYMVFFAAAEGAAGRTQSAAAALWAAKKGGGLGLMGGGACGLLMT